ncbi:hypothetical protein HK103_002476 [Boothiomyces macroporosus]|uniref:Uncharacterized protein n=1 Tax=Boothiomyces macroporosus TaxID=261099 RepID=A0AAD5UJ43_9FUNG|nr:hypothetical protein HK103_002476 [Boothiomyces macroporosus]
MPLPTLLPYQKQPRLSVSKSFENIITGHSTAEEQVPTQGFEIPESIVADQYKRFTEIKIDQQELVENCKLKINELEIKNKQLSLILHDYDQTIQSQAKEIKVLKATLANQEYGSPAHVKVLVSTIDGLQRELHRLREQNSLLMNEDSKYKSSSFMNHARESSGERKSVNHLQFQYRSPRASPTRLNIPTSNLNDDQHSISNSPISRKSNVSPAVSPTHKTASTFSSSFNSPVLQERREFRSKNEKQENFYPASHLFNQKLPSPSQRISKYPSPKSERLGVFANMGKSMDNLDIDHQNAVYSNGSSPSRQIRHPVNSAISREFNSSSVNNQYKTATNHTKSTGISTLGYRVNHPFSNQKFGKDPGVDQDRQTLNTLHDQLNYIGLLLDQDAKDIAQAKPRAASPSLSDNFQTTSTYKNRTIPSSHSVPDLKYRKGSSSFEHRTSILKQPSTIKSPKTATVRINPSPVEEKWATSTTSSPSPTKSMLIQERDLLEQELLEQYERMRKMNGI